MKTLFTLMLLILLPAAHADESEIRQSFQTNFPGAKLERVTKTPFAGLYEIIVDGQLFYADEKGQYIFEGNIIESQTRRNFTEERKRVLFAIDFDKLPLELAVKRVKGNGKRKLAIFTDPNCAYCQKLEGELSTVTNVTIYRFMYPIFPGSPEIVRNVLCSPDPSMAWERWMLSRVRPPKGSCNTQTDKVTALGHKLHIDGTPHIVFANGMDSPGFMRKAELERALDQPRKSAED